jgi:hypothetical protein
MNRRQKGSYVALLIGCIFFSQPRYLLSAEAVHSQNIAPAIHVSMIALLSNPSAYNGQKIITDGVFEFGISESSLFASREWRDNDVAKNALVVRLNPDSSGVNELIKLTGQYVSVEGVFDGRDCGELCLYSGSLKHVDRIQVLHKPASQRSPDGAQRNPGQQG